MKSMFKPVFVGILLTLSFSAAWSADQNEDYPKSFDGLQEGDLVLVPDPNLLAKGFGQYWRFSSPDGNKIAARVVKNVDDKLTVTAGYRTPNVPSSEEAFDYDSKVFSISNAAEKIALQCPIPDKFKVDPFVFPKSHLRLRVGIFGYWVSAYFCDGTLSLEPLDDDRFPPDERAWSRILIHENDVYQSLRYCPRNFSSVKLNQNIKFEKVEGQIRHGTVVQAICLGNELKHYVVGRVTERVKLDGHFVQAEAACFCQSAAIEKKRDGSSRCNLRKHQEIELRDHQIGYTAYPPGKNLCEVTPSELVSVEDIPEKQRHEEWYQETSGFKDGGSWYLGYPIRSYGR